MSARIVVHVVRLDLDDGDHRRPEGLGADDLARAATIRHPRAQATFLASRRALRVHLGARLGCAPERVPLDIGSRGKPHLTGAGLHVSLAHSGSWLAIATSEDCSVGVDVETVRTLPGLDAVVDHLFPPRGRAEVLAATPADRGPVFFRWWTRIEAAVKACGEGLDAAPACLAAAPQESCEAVPGVALAAAGVVCGAAPVVEWRLPVGVAAAGAVR